MADEKAAAEREKELLKKSIEESRAKLENSQTIEPKKDPLRSSDQNPMVLAKDKTEDDDDDDYDYY